MEEQKENVQKIINGLEKRRKDLEKTLVLASQNELFEVVNDVNPRLDEVISLIQWIRKVNE
jgi:flagellar biosynthesis/type III secretory pathway chaperone